MLHAPQAVLAGGRAGADSGRLLRTLLRIAPDNAHEARDYGLARYGMDVKRLLSVMELHLAGKTFMVGEEYTIADMALFPWVHQLRTG